MGTLNIYKSYSFKNKDPVIDQTRTKVQDSKLSYNKISDLSGVSEGTIRNWFHGKTRRPQSASIEAVLRAIGWERKLTMIKRK